jgi:response regulator RpfG family c-di-GMP phosphodiesterase
MSSMAGVLLLGLDAAVVEAFRRVLTREPGVQLQVADDVPGGLARAVGQPPDLLVVSETMGGTDALDVIARLRSDTRFAATRTLVLFAAGSPDRRMECLSRGADDFLTMPVGDAELLARVRAVAVTHRMRETLRNDRVELERLHAALNQSFGQLLDLLVHFIDLMLPGASDRGRRVRELSMKLAARFDIPVALLGELEIAARLHEVGRALTSASRLKGQDGPLGADPARAALASRALLGQVQGLQGVADVLGSVYENWDGSGVPGHSLQGQIPLRSRILRVAIDFLAAMDAVRGARVAEMLECVGERSGTYYDPLVIAHLHAVMGGGEATPEADRERVAVDHLEVGMVLAEDLFTDSGLKLLARETTLTPATLETILRRHRMEPIVRGAVVKRKAAA